MPVYKNIAAESYCYWRARAMIVLWALHRVLLVSKHVTTTASYRPIARTVCGSIKQEAYREVYREGRLVAMGLYL